MILELLEVDRPKTIGEKISEYLARPPKPICKFYGGFSSEVTDGKRHILFAVRNGLPLPLLYGIYVEARYDSLADYAEKTDHIGPFSTDDWRLTLDTTSPAQIELRVGLVPLEIILDRAQIAV
ncbi:unnamed protein product [marine sediment metagenome]|uniref:Uncharacterized protein n=2 Tax=marine sediment metagenome TaxID=412755 RepID=X1RLT0_9ZZZZ